MLILSRRLYETVEIGADLTVTILGFKGNQVSVGITRPEGGAVMRPDVKVTVLGRQGARISVGITLCIGDAVELGSEVKVTVLGRKANQIRVGIKAPPNVEVDRGEVRERKNRERLGGNNE